MNRDWKILDRSILQKTRVFDLYSQRMRSPDGGYEDDFYYLQCPDWVVVVPVTPDRQVVLVKQFRHGINQQSLEIPGGIMSDPAENPAQAAARELQEETGYATDQIVDLGFIHPNPALQSNRCHFFLAKNVELASAQNLDPSEDIEVELHPLSKVPEMIESHQITHALCVAAFFRYSLMDSSAFRPA